MDDYINRHAAVKETWRKSSYTDPLNVLTEIRDRLSALPSADVVEVVRCKDCKWYGEPGCAIQIIDDSDRPKEDDFCSFAERRMDETD